MSYFSFINRIEDYPVCFRIVQAGVLKASVWANPGGQVHMPFQDGLDVFAHASLENGHYTISRFFENYCGAVKVGVRRILESTTFSMITDIRGPSGLLSLENTTNGPVLFRIVRQMGPLAGELICLPGETIRVPTDRIFTFYAHINGLTTPQLTTTDLPATVIALAGDTGHGLVLAKKS